MAPPDTAAMKKHVLTLVVTIAVLDALMIGAYYGFHVSDRTAKTQQTYVTVWVVLTLIFVTTILKRIRRARRGR